jgi:LPXTG-motif cell wall-anchored protein
MRTRTTWLSGVLVAFGLGIFTTGALLAQTKTAVDVRNFEVLAVDGNNLVVRDERGTNIYIVPDDFRFKVNGKPMAAKELKPGMKGQATVTTKTTINPVTVTDVREATVVSTTATSMLVRGSDGVQRRFTQSDLDKRGVEMIKDGRVVRISQLAPGDQLSATIITRDAPTVEREVEVKLAEAKMEPAPAKAAPAAAPAAPAATPAAATTAPPVVASTTPVAPSSPPMKTAPPEQSQSWLLWLAIIAIVIVAYLFMRKKKS